MKTLLTIFSLGFFAGLGLMWSVSAFSNNQLGTQNSDNVCSSDYQEVREPGYQLIAPLLECDAGFIAQRNTSLHTELLDYFTSINIQDTASLYFRDLNTGMWIGINEDKLFPSASMSKVIGVISAYKMYEEDPSFFDEEHIYTNQFEYTRNVPENGSEDFHLQPDTRYTVRELVRRALVYSDNEAIQFLRYVTEKKNPQISNDMVERFSMNTVNGEVTLKNYSNVFRILYNASFLSRSSSEEILKILTETTFEDGMVAAIPKDVRVAHKFGFFDRGANLDEPYRFNHCGIVYLPQKPYLLCISIPTDDLDSFRDSVEWTEEISRITYQWVVAQKSTTNSVSEDKRWTFTHSTLK
ncbi:MAG: serine hydrolase [Pseudomonadales bacterium]|nr:serine hydrolase [Pseudomonadales bacterium]